MQQLLVDCLIRKEQLLVWQLRREGNSYLRIRRIVHRSGSTLWKWYQKVQGLLEDQQRGDVGDALCGVTIFRTGAGATETPFVKDECLVALGF